MKWNNSNLSIIHKHAKWVQDHTIRVVASKLQVKHEYTQIQSTTSFFGFSTSHSINHLASEISMNHRASQASLITKPRRSLWSSSLVGLYESSTLMSHPKLIYGVHHHIHIRPHTSYAFTYAITTMYYPYFTAQITIEKTTTTKLFQKPQH